MVRLDTVAFKISNDKTAVLDNFKLCKSFAISGPPGTGKTTLGVLIAAKASSELEPHQRVLYLTYSKLARAQIQLEKAKLRKRGVVSQEETRRIDVLNFHSLWWDWIKRNYAFLGLPRFPQIRTASEQEDFLNQMTSNLLKTKLVNNSFLTQQGTINSRKQEDWKSLLSASLCLTAFGVSQFGNVLQQHASANQNVIKEAAARICNENLCGKFWHDETVVWASRLIDKNPVFKNYVTDRYPLVLIDEFQDIDGAQWALIKEIGFASIVIFYDKHQLIHAHRGADPSRIEECVTYLKSRDFAGLFELKECNRTSNCFDNLANCRRISIGKEESASKQAAKMLYRLRSLLVGNSKISSDGESVAILVRTNKQADSIVKNLRQVKGAGAVSVYREGAEYSPYDKAREILINIFCSDANCILSTLAETVSEIISPLAQTKLNLCSTQCRTKWKKDVCQEFAKVGGIFNSKLFETFPLEDVVKAVLTHCENGKIATWASVDKRFLGALQTCGERLVTNAEFATLGQKEKRELIDRIINQYEHSHLAQKLSGITVMTVHQSKGREFDHVIIPWCASKDWEYAKSYCPNTGWNNAEEDNNLFLVARTRSVKSVTIFYPADAPSPLLCLAFRETDKSVQSPSILNM